MYVMETCDHNWRDDGDNLAIVCTICGESHDVDFSMSPEYLKAITDGLCDEMFSVPEVLEPVFFDEDFAAALRAEFAEDTQ